MSLSDGIQIITGHSDHGPVTPQNSNHNEAKCNVPISATEQISNLRDTLKDMTCAQLVSMANSWDLNSHYGKERTYEELFQECSRLMKGTSNTKRSDAIRRNTERFFGTKSYQRDGYSSGDHSDDDSSRPARVRAKRCTERARSASPEVHLTVQYFDCPICLDRVPSRSTLILSCCSYEACRNCVVENVGVQMCDKNYSLNCFQCDSLLPAEFEGLVDASVMLAWKTNLALTAVPDCRQCSNCCHIQLVSRTSASFPLITCASCRHEYCYEHGDAHSGKPCPPKTDQDVDSEFTIRAISKPCPDCTVKIERNGGCPHMTCGVCNCSWCWNCGKKRYGGTDAGNRVELLNTNTNTSNNWWSALLFHFIRFLAPNSVFYAPNTCSCSKNHFHQYTTIECVSDTPRRFAHNPVVLFFLSLTIALYVSLQRANQGQFLFGTYLVYVACHVTIFLMEMLGYYTYCAGYYACMALLSAYSYFSGPLGHVCFPIVMGGCVYVLSQHAPIIFAECFRCSFRFNLEFLRRVTDSIRNSGEYSGKVNLVHFLVLVPVSVAVLIYGAPIQPDHSMWTKKFWIAWLFCHVLLTIYNDCRPYYNKIGDRGGWEMGWLLLAIAFNSVITIDHLTFCYIAGVVLLSGTVATASELWQHSHKMLQSSLVIMFLFSFFFVVPMLF